jgi:DUF2971 family protein
MEHVVDIDSLQHFTDSIGSYSQYLVQDFGGQLFHYSDLNALTNIINSSDLWLTNSRYCNDAREMIHGYDIAKEVIEKKRKEAKSKTIKNYLDQVAKFVDEQTKGVYVCCFCEEDNLLSQWRSYGENGTGVSIGFDPFGFTAYTGSDLPPKQIGLMRLWKVFYDPQVQKNIVEKALELVPKLNVNDTNIDKARKAADAIHFFIPTFKNQDFQEEKERRLIFTPSQECTILPSYRVRKGMLVPYYSLKALGEKVYGTSNKLPINKITLGPSAWSTLNLESTEMLLQQNGYLTVLVSVSDTPYRG